MTRFFSLSLLLAVLTMAADTAAAQPDDAAGPPLVYAPEEALQLPAPGNVFTAGEAVRVAVPASAAGTAAVAEFQDERGVPVFQANVVDGVAAPADAPGIGWYRVAFRDGDGAALGWTTAAVLEPFSVNPAIASPVAVDVALAWVAPDNAPARQNMARLAALTGAGWVRDRLRRRDVEPVPGEYVEDTKYDETARTQSELGQRVLQVFHDFPKWGRDADGAADLRLLHAFCRDMAKRFGDHVPAWEPWNEANARSFGGWPIAEMCAWQKAAWFGFKAGRPETTVCWMPIAGVNTPALVRGILENETWPYYDVYTIHSYDWCHDYDRLWAGARDAASGRPLWVTESDRGLSSPDGMPHGEVPLADAVLKAQFVAQEYAFALSAGAEKCFHFILGQYMEEHGGKRIQFGLLREDMTPRPGYAALANLGRRLAGTRCLGLWSPPEQPDTHVAAFRGGAPGTARDVVVVWAEKPLDWYGRGKFEAPWPLPETLGAPTACHDYLGRPIAPPDKARSAAVFLEFPLGAADTLTLSSPPVAERRAGEPCPVVLQPHFLGVEIRRTSEGWTDEHDPEVPLGQPVPMRVWVYNFGDTAAGGVLRAESLPDGCTLTPAEQSITIEPGGRVLAEFELHAPAGAEEPEGGFWLRLRGEFGGAGRPVTAMRLRTAPKQP
ncbi:MAG: hypothetical protein GX580_09425 [Candidatus Hydrogenedens sp.]|nr:hypothetical protein [Candidatus Hydrogenedentota bacterium]NLF57847.1 hypothetical protein [Candidatus Hydrogenedens sp.]